MVISLHRWQRLISKRSGFTPFYEWSLEQANSYVNDVIDAFEGLRDGSKRGRFTDIRPGYLKYAVGSHVIYFREHANMLLVVRILHGRMDVGRHL